MSNETNNNEYLLKVDHLKQYSLFMTDLKRWN